jgi:phenylalanyl-tRNA synthetase alpha chain
MSDLIKQVSANLDYISSITDLKSLEENRLKFLGKNGLIITELKRLGELSIEEKKSLGKQINELKDKLTEAYEARKQQLLEQETTAKLQSEYIDLSLPGREVRKGTIHPITQVMRELAEIFGAMGFEIKEGPDVETDYYNFTALNIPEYHPARDMHDTFYVDNKDEKLVLRTHTSPVQIRTMEKGMLPLKFISMGRTYRCDYDATHTPMFHQIEAVYVDKKVNMTDLKGCLQNFFNSFFETSNIKIRLRPSYFPFTEPSAEVDIAIGNDSDRWLEILGSGMIHPHVLRNVGIDPAEYQGFAFGMGIERIAMLKYGMTDLRQFFESDIRWLKKYGFEYFDIPSLIRGLGK